jgi:hypothetical protein
MSGGGGRETHGIALWPRRHSRFSDKSPCACETRNFLLPFYLVRSVAPRSDAELLTQAARKNCQILPLPGLRVPPAFRIACASALAL